MDRARLWSENEELSRIHSVNPQPLPVSRTIHHLQIWRSLLALSPVRLASHLPSPLALTASNTSSLVVTLGEISRPINWLSVAQGCVLHAGESLLTSTMI